MIELAFIGYQDDWCGAKIGMGANKAGLCLLFDCFHGSSFAPEYHGIRLRDLQHAEELFEDHQTGRNH